LPNVSLGSWNSQTDLLGYGLEIFRLKFLRKRIPEGLEKEGLFGFADNHPGGRSREFIDDAEHVLLEDFADG